jgi:hypothetical protein
LAAAKKSPRWAASRSGGQVEDMCGFLRDAALFYDETRRVKSSQVNSFERGVRSSDSTT